jgi:RNA polymerase sigma factor (TIGR02999 family)
VVEEASAKSVQESNVIDHRLTRIQQIAQQAMQLSVEERAEFLDRMSGDDRELRIETELVLSRLEEEALHPAVNRAQRGGTGAITMLLVEAGRGDESATTRFWSLVYEDLRLIARRLLVKEARHDMPQVTSLVHRAYERISRGRLPGENRAEFFRAAKTAMWRILVEIGRRPPLPSGDDAIERIGTEFGVERAEVLAIHEALARLERSDPRMAQVVWWRMFAGVSVHTTAEILDVSERTVKEEWRRAREWLRNELSQGHSRAQDVHHR